MFVFWPLAVALLAIGLVGAASALWRAVRRILRLIDSIFS